mgnify:CR=1 FL=1
MAPDARGGLFDTIAGFVEPGSTVLDLGCGEGDLLEHLIRTKNVRGRGVDLSEEMILTCVSKGLSVYQGDLNEGLQDYSTAGFDYAILSRTLQVVQDPVALLREMIRVGKKVVVNFPNFGYLPVRLNLLFRGRMPVTRSLPYQWHDTPNIHLCTRKDFLVLCRDMGIRILKETALRGGGVRCGFCANALANEVCFLLEGSS